MTATLESMNHFNWMYPDNSKKENDEINIMVGGSQANQEMLILSKHDGLLMGLVSLKKDFQSISKCSDCFFYHSYDFLQCIQSTM